MVPQVPKHVDRITAAVTRNLNRVNEGYNANEAMMSKLTNSTTTQTQGHSSSHTQRTQQPQDNVELTESTAGREPDAEVKINHEQQDNSNLPESALPITTHPPIEHETFHNTDKPRQPPVLEHGHNHNTESAVNHVLETDTRMPQPISTRSQPQEPPTRATSDMIMSIGPQDPEAWLTQDMEKFFPIVLKPPDFDQTPRPKLCRLLVAVSEMKEETPAKDNFRYERTQEAAEHNTEIIKRYGCDLEHCFQSMKNSTLSPGSEFRNVDHLKLLIGRHPYWPNIHKTLTEGALPPVKAEPHDMARRTENAAQIERGNHKSARDDKDLLHNHIEKHIKKGYVLPITAEVAPRLRHARIIPMSIQHQHSIDADGLRIAKTRPVQDQTFSNGHCPSTNDLTDDDQLTDLVYGKCLDRIFHWIVATRSKHPNRAIFISKFDIDAAYLRINSHPRTCARTVVIDEDGIAHIYLRLTFGGKPNPAIFCEVSEVATDLANEILLSDEWHPDIVSGPLKDYIGKPKREPDDVPFAPSAPMAVDPQPNDNGKVDVFVDDLIATFLDSLRNIERVPAVIPLVLSLLGRPVSDDEPIDRNEFLSIIKLLAEGTPAEIQTVLGWILDTRRLLVQLPQDKYDEWINDIDTIIKGKQCQWKLFQTVKGRLNHCGSTIPHLRHFLNRMHEFETRQGGNSRNENSFVRVPHDIKEDLALHKEFLGMSREGVSMNLLTARRPTHVFASDSCKETNGLAGMGGYSVTSGRAWRFKFPDHVANSPHISNNLLEYMATVVTIWIDQLHGDIPPESSVLSTSDSSSSVGWLRKSSFRHYQPGHEKVSRHVARMAIEGKWALNPQHLRGIWNKVSDILSRWFHMTDDEILTHLRTHLHSQIPKTFQLFHLPKQITAWISSIVESTIASGTARPKPASKSTTGPGDDGLNTSSSLESTMTPSWTTSNTPEPKQHSSNSSSSECALPNLQQIVMKNYVATLSEKPLASWWRASGQTAGKAPATSRSATTRSFDPK